MNTSNEVGEDEVDWNDNADTARAAWWTLGSCFLCYFCFYSTIQPTASSPRRLAIGPPLQTCSWVYAYVGRLRWARAGIEDDTRYTAGVSSCSRDRTAKMRGQWSACWGAGETEASVARLGGALVLLCSLASRYNRLRPFAPRPKVFTPRPRPRNLPSRSPRSRWSETGSAACRVALCCFRDLALLLKLATASLVRIAARGTRFSPPLFLFPSPHFTTSRSAHA